MVVLPNHVISSQILHVFWPSSYQGNTMLGHLLVSKYMISSVTTGPLVIYIYNYNVYIHTKYSTSVDITQCTINISDILDRF